MAALLNARVAVVGHLEYIDFAIVPRLPHQGEILHAHEFFALAAGGGAVAAMQMLKLTGAVRLYCALAGDDYGRRALWELEAAGVTVYPGRREPPQRRGFVFLDDQGERTITILGERLVAHGDDPLPWQGLEGFDGVYVTGGDRAALAHARRARIVVASPRAGQALMEADVPVDVLVRSGADAGEALDPAALDPPPGTVVTTLGDRGGRWAGALGEGRWAPEPLTGPRVDAYGAGDSFAAGLTTGLAAGLPIAEAVRLGARCGAANMTGRGPYAGQLDLR